MPSLAHADVDLAAGITSVSASYDTSYGSTPDGGQGSGPLIAFDGGARLLPWLSLVGFATLAVYRDRDVYDAGSIHMTAIAAGPALRVHWQNAFVGVGGGIAEWRASFDDGTPTSWSSGLMARLELGFTTEDASGRVHGLLAARLARSWFSDAAAVQYSDPMSATLTSFELLVGVAF